MDKTWSTQYAYKTKDRVTRIPLKTGVELRCSGRDLSIILDLQNFFHWYILQNWKLETKDTASSASFLDAYLEFDDSGQLSTKIYDKRDDFNFKIINLPNMCRYQRSRIRISKKNRQHNGQKKKVQMDKTWSTKYTYKTKDRVTRIPLKTVVELRCSGRVNSSCSTSGTRPVIIFVANFNDN
jgi:hypothetical protein